MFCKQEIVMSDRASGNWLPYNFDGSMHDCKTAGTKTNQRRSATSIITTTTQVEATTTKPLSLEGLDVRLKKVEKMLFQNGS